MLDHVARFRRFARAVTSEVGALDSSFLGRGRPLGSARFLNAVGHGRSELGDVRHFLKLDSGLASRLLRGLEDEDLITTVASETDARRRLLVLTPAGQREFEAYERLSDERAGRLLARAENVEALLDAFDLVGTALSSDPVEFQMTDPRSPESRFCLEQYYGELTQSFDEGFDVSLSLDPSPEQMLSPRGAFIVALSDGLPIGCVGLKGSGDRLAEIKRLWVAPAARGMGLATDLMAQAETAARALSIDTLRLDTNRALSGALHLYRKLGWVEIERFNADPYADLFFERRLDRS